MPVAGQRRADGFLEDVAGAVAGVIRRRPVATMSLLAASIAVVLGEPRGFGIDPALLLAWVVAASFLMGAALARSTASQGTTWRMDPSDGVVLVIGIFVASNLLLDHEIGTLTARLAIVGVAFGVGDRPRNPIAVTVAVGLAVVTMAPSGLTAAIGHQLPNSTAYPALYAGWLAVLGLTLCARQGRWVIALPLAIAFVVWRDSAIWDFWSLRAPSTKEVAGFSEILVLAVASTLLPVIAGRAAAALSRNECVDASRLGVRIQRDPWRTALIAFLLGTALFRSDGLGPSPAHVLVAVAGMACLAHLVVGPTWSPASLAPWIAVSALCVPLSMEFYEPFPARSFRMDILPGAAVLLYVPLAVGLAASRARTNRFPWWGWLAVVVVVAFGVASLSSGSSRVGAFDAYGSARDAEWCVSVSLLVHAVVTSQVSARVVLCLSPLVSFLVIDGFYAIRNVETDAYLHPSPIPPALLAGPIAALLALGARRVRSMTALPEDHPSLELAGARPGFPEA